MKNEKWIIYVIIAFTSITTILLLADGTFIGFVRGVIAATLIDGLIGYWEDKRTKLKKEIQRKWAEGMMWAGVGVVAIFAVGYVVEHYAPVDAVKQVDLFGYQFTATLTDMIVMLAGAIIGLWIAATLGVVLYMRGVDPDIEKDLEHTKALEERDREEMTAYKEALKVTARQIGTEKAIKLFKHNLSREGYTPAEIAIMEQDARAAISKAQVPITVDVPMNQYRQEAENFTPPSTPKN